MSIAEFLPDPTDLEAVDKAMRKAQEAAEDPQGTDLGLVFALTHIVAHVAQMEEEIKAYRALAQDAYVEYAAATRFESGEVRHLHGLATTLPEAQRRAELVPLIYGEAKVNRRVRLTSAWEEME